MTSAVVAICTYNRAVRLPALVSALRAQECHIPWRILFVDNNSTDDTSRVLEQLSQAPGVPLTWVREPKPGIVPARNRAVEECLNSDYMLVMDDDESPLAGWIASGLRALQEDGAECVGGRVRVRFDPVVRPRWLGDDLLGFLAQVEYGDAPFWIESEATPVWTANVGYRTALFRSGLRFDARYSRVGNSVGGGEDVAMFQSLLGRRTKIRYAPDMVVEHSVEPWRLRRTYFLRLHYTSGYKSGRFEMRDRPGTVAGVPPYLLSLAAKQAGKMLATWLRRETGWLRQGMNFTHAVGLIAGCHGRWKLESRADTAGTQ